MQMGGTTMALSGYPGLMTGFSAGLMPGVTTAHLLSTESPSKVICLSQVSLYLVIYYIYVVISM